MPPVDGDAGPPDLLSCQCSDTESALIDRLAVLLHGTHPARGANFPVYSVRGKSGCATLRRSLNERSESGPRTPSLVSMPSEVLAGQMDPSVGKDRAKSSSVTTWCATF